MSKASRPIFLCATVLCFFAVAIGAFGAHALMAVLVDNGRVATFATASDYHFYHALAMLVLSVIPVSERTQKIRFMAFVSMLVGVIIFSGSLYLLCLTNFVWLGAITPIGGLFLLFSWGLLIKYSLINDYR